MLFSRCKYPEELVLCSEGKFQSVTWHPPSMRPQLDQLWETLWEQNLVLPFLHLWGYMSSRVTRLTVGLSWVKYSRPVLPEGPCSQLLLHRARSQQAKDSLVAPRQDTCQGKNRPYTSVLSLSSHLNSSWFFPQPLEKLRQEEEFFTRYPDGPGDRRFLNIGFWGGAQFFVVGLACALWGESQITPTTC